MSTSAKTNFNTNEVTNFTYSSKNFTIECNNWENNNKNLSNFDTFIQDLWDNTQNKSNAFRYKYIRNSSKYKIINCPDDINGPMIAQLNEFRGTKKRTRPDFNKIDEGFDPEMFNFRKLHQNEVLCTFKHEIEDEDNSSEGSSLNESDSENYIIINCAPIEYCHILLVPELELGHNQIIGQKCIRQSIDLLLLSNQPSFRVMYNSLWAWASINHCHVHAFYMDFKVGGDSMSVQNSSILPNVFRTIDEKVYLPAFVWENIEDRNVGNKACFQIEKLAKYLTERLIPHNIMFLYKTDTRKPRAIVWPRKSVKGFQPDPSFDVAVAEVAGHFPYKTLEKFEKADYESAITHIQENLLEPVVYDEIEEWIRKNL